MYVHTYKRLYVYRVNETNHMKNQYHLSCGGDGTNFVSSLFVNITSSTVVVLTLSSLWPRLNGGLFPNGLGVGRCARFHMNLVDCMLPSS